MEVSGQLHVPATHWIGGWVFPRAGLEAVVSRKSLSPTAIRATEHPARSLAMYY